MSKAKQGFTVKQMERAWNTMRARHGPISFVPYIHVPAWGADPQLDALRIAFVRELTGEADQTDGRLVGTLSDGGQVMEKGGTVWRVTGAPKKPDLVGWRVCDITAPHDTPHDSAIIAKAFILAEKSK